jgi:uroporphyrinogen decarboxylase
MTTSPSRRGFLRSVLGSAAALSAGRRMSAAMNKRDAMLALLDGAARHDYVPAAFFIHFGDTFRFGPPAVQKHLEYFRYTGMDFVKIQYERTFPQIAAIKRPADWKSMPSYKLDF